MKSFHERLKEARRERKVSIGRLCRDLKINKATYENWELGVYPSRPELYKRLADYGGSLGVLGLGRTETH